MIEAKMQTVLQEARARLKDDPFDAGHDYVHHALVIQNCISITRQEGIKLSPDSEGALRIAALWHDYKRGNEEENDRILTDTMLVAGFGDNFIHRVLSIKNSHSYGNTQKSIEAKILFDADKLEYVSAIRYKHISAAIRKGEMSLETLAKYKMSFRERIGQIREQLHFETSRKLFDKRMPQAIEYQKVDPLWSDLFEMI